MMETLESQETKFKIGRKLIRVKLEMRGNRLYIFSRYNPKLIDEIKCFENPKWHGKDKKDPVKAWSIPLTSRNKFTLDYLQKKNPYERYLKELSNIEPSRPEVLPHQKDMINHILTRHYCILACEMGLGKTLSAIEGAELAEVEGIWYVGPKSGVRAVSRELIKWGARIAPKMMTYEGMVKKVNTEKYEVPQMIIFDESSKLKTKGRQRSNAAKKITDQIRETYLDNGYIILMTGTPSPKSPEDWWHQCEIACPGYIKESQPFKFKQRYSIMRREELPERSFNKLLSWKDNENKCAICGKFEKDHTNGVAGFLNDIHVFEKSINEVDKLHKRLKGLVLFQLKKDYLDLPEKTYEEIRIKPDPDLLRTAKTIANTAVRTIEALTLTRQLSDGFQYKKMEISSGVCDVCDGKGRAKIKESLNPLNRLSGIVEAEDDFIEVEKECPNCEGSGKDKDYKRIIEKAKTPKDEYFLDYLDEHESIGRFIVWGGFTATVDRLEMMALKAGWAVLRVDGRGYKGITPDGLADENEMLDAMDRSHKRFDELMEKYPKICFVGNPGAGGMALTLTASPTELFFSNTFIGEQRMQAEDRIHRTGMDENRGAKIVDLLLLPPDKLVLDNLKQKKDLQAISMGDLKDCFERR